jgi:uncharacterized membrane protein YhhN
MTYAVFCVMMVFLVACFISCRFLQNGKGAIFAKTMASLGFVVGAVLAFGAGYYYYSLYILIGLVCGMLGDIFIELRKMYTEEKLTYFNAGMACFALGHIMYIIAILKIVGKVNLLTDILVSIGVAVAFSVILFFVLAKPMKLDFGKCKWQSFLYCIQLTFTMMFALMSFINHNLSIYMMLGLVSFLLSDLVLSMQFFGGGNKEDNKLFVALNHILYYGAQVLIVGVLYL